MGDFIRICGTRPNPELPTSPPEKCPRCGEPPEQNYGLCGGGCGLYWFCCGEVLAKIQDEEVADG